MPPTEQRRLVTALFRAGFQIPQIAGIAHLSPDHVEQLLSEVRTVARAVTHRERAWWGSKDEDASADFSLTIELHGLPP